MHRMTMTALAVVTSLTLCWTIPASAACPQVDTGGRIMALRLHAEEGIGFDLISVSPSGADLTVLSNEGRDLWPDISPDGASVVIQHQCYPRFGEEGPDPLEKTANIWVMKPDGSDRRRLTSCDGTICLRSSQPSYSFDGRRIVFVRRTLVAGGGETQGIFTMRTDGSQVRHVTDVPFDGLYSGEESPHFSPNGRRIVYVQIVDGRRRLMIVNVDGLRRHRLLPGVEGMNPRWSPTGREIAFTYAHPDDFFKRDIAVVRPDGSYLKLLTHDAGTGRSASNPAFSPSGQQIVFGEELEDLPCRLATMTRTGTRVRTVVYDSAYCGFFSPTWGRAPAGHRS